MTVWHHVGGKGATISSLAAALAPHARVLAEENVAIYSSNDFKVGVDSKALEDHVAITTDLYLVDPRGGCFQQEHMAVAVGSTIKRLGYDGALADATKDLAQTAEAMYGLIALKLRVMCAHTRMKYDSGDAKKAPGLEPAFEVLRTAPPAGSDKQNRREARLGKRPHPFLNFRTAAPEDSEDEPSTMIGAFFDHAPAKFYAYKVMSDGATIMADEYHHGPEGRVHATWLDDMFELVLDVPNEHLLPDGTLTAVLPARNAGAPPLEDKPPGSGKHGSGRKKSSAGGKRGLGEGGRGRGGRGRKNKSGRGRKIKKADDKREDEEQADIHGGSEQDVTHGDPKAIKAIPATQVEADTGEDTLQYGAEQNDENHGAAPLQLKIIARKGRTMCLFIWTGSEDKCQIMEVRPDALQEGTSARDVCEQAKARLQPVVDSMVGPAKNHPNAKELREQAREVRAEFLRDDAC